MIPGLAGRFALAVSAFAAPVTIISAGGTGNGQAVAAWIGETWTQTSSDTKVTISATLNGGVASPSTASVYLMNQLGPGTTLGANQIASQLVTIPGNTSGATLFTGLTLGPGTYYLLANEIDAGWTGTVSPVYSEDAGVTNVSSFTKNGAITAYAPDTPYELTSGAFFFSVSGTPGAPLTAAPEPATSSLLLLFAAPIWVGLAVKRLQMNKTSYLTRTESCHASNIE